MGFLFAIIIVPLVLLLYFGIKQPQYMWLTIGICPIVDILSLYQDFMYYESRPIIIILTILHTVLIAGLVTVIRKMSRHK